VKSTQRWYRRHQLFNHPVNPVLSHWLFDDSSLTSHIKALCGAGFSVRVISQQWQTIAAEDACAMALKHAHSALVRQVVLCCDEQPLVYAITIIPSTTVQGRLRRYANIGNRPLGEMLFSDRTMRREEVQVARLPGWHAAYQFTESDEEMWGRRSVFRVSEKPLLVAEYFLPELFNYSKS